MGSDVPQNHVNRASTAGQPDPPSILVPFHRYSQWDQEIIGIFFSLMRTRQNTLVSK